MGFSVKKRDNNTILGQKCKICDILVARHEKVGQSQKKWGSRKFGSKKRDCPSKIGTVGKYADSLSIATTIDTI